jgi:hypothetical protein
LNPNNEHDTLFLPFFSPPFFSEIDPDHTFFSTEGKDSHSCSLCGCGAGRIGSPPLPGDGQPGYAGVPLIELYGASAGAGVTGLTITGGGTLAGLGPKKGALMICVERNSSISPGM